MQFRRDVAMTFGEVVQSLIKAGYDSFLVKDVATNPFGVDKPLTREQMESAFIREFTSIERRPCAGFI